MKKMILLFAVIVFPFLTYTFSQQKVKATYYADKFHGRKTASGVKYNKDSLTCAHKTLRFGTVVKVTNPKNGKTVYVNVNDRGPFVKGRTIDLSHAAAKKIGIFGMGIATVEMTILDSMKSVQGDKANPEETTDSVNIEQLKFSLDSIICKPVKMTVFPDTLRLAQK